MAKNDKEIEQTEIPERPGAAASSGERATWDLLYGAKPAQPITKNQDYSGEIIGGGAGLVGGSAVGAIAGGKLPIQIGGFTTRKQPDLSSIESEHPDVGRPLTEMEMQHPAGQVVEKNRRLLNAKVNERNLERGLYDAESVRLQNELSRYMQALPALQNQTRSAAAPYVQMGGVQSPEIRVTSAINRQMPMPDTTAGAQAPDPNFSTFMGRFDPQTGTYARENETGFNTGTRNVHQTMRTGDAGMNQGNAPALNNETPISQQLLNRYANPLGRILVDPDTQRQGMQSRFPPQPTLEDSNMTAAQREQAQIMRNIEYQRFQQGHQLAQSDLTSSQGLARNAGDALYRHQQMELERMMPHEEALLDPMAKLNAARGQLPSKPMLMANSYGKAAPVLGGGMYGLGAGLFGAKAFDEEDPVRANMAKMGAYSGMLGTLPHYSTRGAGALGMLAALLGLTATAKPDEKKPDNAMLRRKFSQP